MYAKKLTYTDFNGNEATETLLFHLSQTDIVKANFSSSGNLENKLRKMVEEKDVQAIANIFSDLIGMSYGKMSDDGKKFYKNAAIREEFECSAAYDALYMELLQSTDSALAFIKGILPTNLSKELDKELENNEEIKALVAETKA